MSNSNEGKMCEPVKLTAVEEVSETLGYIYDDISGLLNRIYSACERVGVHFDKGEDAPTAPPPYGSIPQLHEKVRDVGNVISQCQELMHKLEGYI